MTKPGGGSRSKDPQTQRALAHMAEGLDDREPTDRRAAEVVLAAAEREAPRDTGRLASSHRIATGDGGATVTAGEGIEYAAVIHWGWAAHHIEAQPWLYDAASGATDAVADVYRDRVAELVQRVEREAP